MASGIINNPGDVIETKFTLGSGVTKWTCNTLKIDTKNKIAHFWLSYYGKMDNNQGVGILPSGYTAKEQVRFPADIQLQNGNILRFTHYIAANSPYLNVDSNALDGNTLQYIEVTGEIPLN